MKDLKELPLFINVAYRKDGKENSAHIQTRGMCSDTQDAQIGNFSANWYIRPRRAVLRLPYKTLASYKSACSRALLRANVADSIEYYYIDGKEYGERVKI